jgi:hypothetical protein
LKYVLPLPVLVRIMARIRPRPRAGDEERILALAAAFGRLRPRSQGNCLERSLLAYRFLLGTGCAPELVLGVNKTDRVSGHAWVTLNGAPVGHAHDGVFDPIIVFGPDGGPDRRSWSRKGSSA